MLGGIPGLITRNWDRMTLTNISGVGSSDHQSFRIFGLSPWQLAFLYMTCIGAVVVVITRVALMNTHFDHDNPHLEEVFQVVCCPAVIKKLGVPLEAKKVSGIFPAMNTKKQPMDQRIFTIEGPSGRYARVTIWYTNSETDDWKYLYVDFGDLTRFIFSKDDVGDRHENAGFIELVAAPDENGAMRTIADSEDFEYVRKEDIPENLKLRVGMRQKDPFGDFAPVKAWKKNLLIPLAVIAFVFAAVLVFFKMRKGTSMYQHVKNTLMKDPTTLRVFGEPLDFPDMYDARITGREADMNFTFKGSKREGKCYVRAMKTYDMWQFTRSFLLVFKDAESRKIEFEINDYRSSTFFKKKTWAGRKQEKGFWFDKSDSGV